VCRLKCMVAFNAPLRDGGRALSSSMASSWSSSWRVLVVAACGRGIGGEGWQFFACCWLLFLVAAAGVLQH
jgi:hypothetical protein